MKKSTLLLFSSLILSASSTFAEIKPVRAIGIDPVFSPISEANLTSSIKKSRGNAVALLKLIDRAQASRQGKEAFAVLDTQRKLYPRNAEGLLVYCWAYKQDLGTAYIKKGDYRQRAGEEEKIFKSTFDLAKKLAPKHWLVSLLDGYVSYSRGVENFQKALPLLETTIHRSPADPYARALCWRIYGGALNLAAMRGFIYKGKRVGFQDSADALETAGKIYPRGSSTWLTLFGIYRYNLKNKKKALRSKSLFLATFPKHRKLPKIAEQLFAGYS